MPGVPLPLVEAAVSWDDYISGTFTIGYSDIGEADKLAGSSYGAGFTGAYDVLARPDGITINRGRANDLTVMSEGTCTINATDENGRYDVNNGSSPIAGKIRPMRPVRVSVTYDSVVYRRYRGFLRDLTHDPVGRIGGRVTIASGDLFMRMGGDPSAKPVIPSTGATTTGAVIGKVLDAIGLYDPGFRDLDTGDSLADFSADGSLTALQIIEALLVAERGVFFVARDGVAKYVDRHHRYSGLSVGTVTNTMRRLSSGSSVDTIINRQRVTKTGGVEQLAENYASVQLYDRREGGAIETPYLATDAAAASLASYIVARRKDPRQALWAVDLENRDHATYVQMLARDLGDVVTIVEAETGSSGDYVIEAIREQIDFARNRHTVTWTVSKAIADAPFLIGVSLLGSDDVLDY